MNQDIRNFNAKLANCRGGRVARRAKMASKSDSLPSKGDSNTIVADTARRYPGSVGEAANAESDG